MDSDKPIEGFRKTFASKTNIELIREVERWDEKDARCIAAKQLLEERRLRIEKLTLKFVVAGFIVAVITLIIAWLSWRHPVR